MIKRPLWSARIRESWTKAPIVWLCGVRRSGKTTLTRDLPAESVHYVNCDLPVSAQMLRDPELFYRECRREIVVFDEIHQLEDPSRVLKIGADAFPNLKILATGSSTLAATRKFRDTLTGRKRTVHLTPVTFEELADFGAATLKKRLLHGGLPQPLLAETPDPGFYREWLDSFFSRDIQGLFAFHAPEKFNALFEYLLRQSGGLFEVAKAASGLGISRPTITAHLRALEITQAVTILRPFFGGGGQKELTKMPKVYAFDTGFVCFAKGWDTLRPEDCGVLWEHLVLEFLQARRPDADIRYWRNKAGRELDFVLPRNRDRVDVLECKWNPQDFDPAALKAFRALHPGGRNYVISPVAGDGFVRRLAGLEFTVCDPTAWAARGHISS